MDGIRAENGLLVVREGTRIPKVCVKCGATKDVSRRDHAFAVGAHGANAGAAGGVVGAMVANVLRNAFRDQPVTQALILIGIFAFVITLAVVVQRATTKLHLEVPLCGEHHAALDTAVRARTWLILAMSIAGVLTIYGIGSESIAILVVAMLVFFVPLGIAYAIGVPKAWLKVGWVRDGMVALAVGPEIASKIASRAEKRARKKAAGDRADAEHDADADAEHDPDDAPPPAAA